MGLVRLPWYKRLYNRYTTPIVRAVGNDKYKINRYLDYDKDHWFGRLVINRGRDKQYKFFYHEGFMQIRINWLYIQYESKQYARKCHERLARYVKQ